VADLSLDSSLRVSEDVVSRELDGEAVILNLASGVYFGLDPVGTRVWQLIEHRGCLKDVLSVMRDEFDAPAEKIEGDLLQLASELLQKGLVRRVDNRTTDS
jgi:hypothetical protein